MQNLHSHTSYSNLFAAFKDSHISYLDYCKRAYQLGHRVVTSVEHGSQGNFLRCWEAVQNYNASNPDANLKFVFGTEAYWVSDRKTQDDTNAHVLILARNKEGAEDLNEILSIANEDGFYKRPRIDDELIYRLKPENHLITTACVSGWGKIDKNSGEIMWYGSHNSMEFMENRIKALKTHFGSSLYLEVQAHDTIWQKQLNKEILRLHYALEIPLIAGLDSHYITSEQAQERKYLREESGVRMGDEDHEYDNGVYEDYPDDKTLIERFQRQGVLSCEEIRIAMSNTDVALSFDDISYTRERKLPAYNKSLTQQQRNELYNQRVWQGWDRYKPSVPKEKWPVYKEGIAQEIDTVTSTGVADYFLINEHAVRRGKELGGIVTPTGRGSAGSFFTNTLLGMSTLDRFSLPVHLYPERFVTADRLKTSLPDIDINIAEQVPFVAAQREILGEEHVYPMISYGTLKTKSAFKLYARANNMEAILQNEVSRQIENFEKAVLHAEEDEKDDIFIEDYVDKQFLPYIEGSKPYRGIVVSKSPAPCAFLLYDGDIRREIGLMRVTSKSSKKSVLCTCLDGYTLDDFGYVKSDWLIVSVLSVNAMAMKMAGLPSYTSQDIIRLTKNDKKTWDIFAKGFTVGINQCEKQNTTQRLMQYKPRTLEDLAAFVAAIRPGFKSQLASFVARQPFSYHVPSFDAMLQNDSTGSSWLLYQENLMSCLHTAGFTMEETYPLIKAISKKKRDVITSAKERFLQGFTAHIVKTENLSEEQALSASTTVWQVMEDSASYLFNASHAVAVALDALYGAYLKANHPYEYYCALLTSVAKKGDKERLAAIRAEMRKAFGITMQHCKFGQDNRVFTIDKENKTIFDVLMSAKGLSFPTAKALNDMKDSFFSSFVDFLYAAEYVPAINRAKLEILIRIGYFEEFGSDGKLLKVLSAFKDGPIAFKKNHIPATQKKRLAQLNQYESQLPEEHLSDIEKLKAEINAYCTPLSIFTTLKRTMVVLDVNTKYSPKITMYNTRNGNTGQLKVLKSTFASNPLEVGNIVRLETWDTQPKYSYVNGKRIPIPGTKEVWLRTYQKVC